MLWVLASSVSQPILAEAKAEAHPDWLPGIYFCGSLFKTAIVMTAPVNTEDEELLMALSQAYLEWEQATEQRGEQKVVEALLKTRFTELDAALAEIVPQILTLPTEEYTGLILQLSREELLARFSASEN